MKKIYLLSIFVVLSLQSIFAQFIWHPDLGVPVFDTIRLSADTRSRIVRIDTGDEFGRPGTICESLNNQLLATGVGWTRLDYVENPETGSFELCFDLDENTENISRSIHLGDASRAYIIFTQIGINEYPLFDLPNGNSFCICPGEQIELKLRNTAENQTYDLEHISEPKWKYASYEGTSKGITCLIEPPSGTYKFKNFGDEFEVFYYDAFNYMYGLGEEVFTMDANGGVHKFYFNWYIDENMQQHSVSCADDIDFLVEPFERYNAGKSKYWNPHIRLSFGYDEEVDRAYLQVTCPPNLSSTYINNGSGLMVSENIRLDVQQYANGSVVKSPVDYTYNKQRSVIEITIKTTQPEVIYTVYRDGVLQRDYIGTGEPLFIAMPKKPGKYRIVAHYEEDGNSDSKELIKFHYNEDMIAIDNEKNCVLTKTYFGENSHIYDIDYFNGLGLLEQSVGVEASPNDLDLIQPFDYDNRLRPDAKTYLPYEVASYDGRFRSSFDSEQSSFYTKQYGSDDGTRAFFEQVYEAAPFDRVQKQAVPGKMKKSVRYTTMGYFTNQADEVYNLTVNNAGDLVCNDYYDAGSLSRSWIVDANEQRSVIYTNGLGQTILNRRVDNQQFVDTYSVYDADGLLRWVVSPNGSDSLMQASPIPLSSGFARRHCYAYVYDNRGNLIKKYLPGRDPIYYAYDAKDRLTKQQDGNMRAGLYSPDNYPQWISYIYDEFNRLTKQYVITDNTGTQNILQSIDDDSSNATIDNSTSSQIIAQYTYDSYEGCPAALEFVDIDGYTTEEGQTQSFCDRRVRGLLTHERLGVITPTSLNTNYLDRVFYYDYLGRIIQTVETDKTDGNIHRTTSKYDFIGNLIAQCESYTHDGTTDNITRTYTYDLRNRLTRETAQLNDGQTATTSYTYDGLGRLETKKYGEGANAINETYTYNIQGALATKNNDLFHLDLRYYNPVYDDTPVRYTGDISELHWQHLGDGANNSAKNSYQFSYDKMARFNNMQQRIDDMVNNQNVERKLLYDKNGNLKTLLRYGNGVETDNQLFEYVGNQILDVSRGKVQDANLLEIKQLPYNPNIPILGDPVRMITYLYDKNGNISDDYYKSDMSYSYNILNLLSQAKNLRAPGGIMGIPEQASYSYLADGTKVSAERSPFGKSYKYVGSFVYNLAYLADGSGSVYTLESASFGDGRIIAGQSGTSGTYTPHYFLTDHLGSVRVVAEDKNTVLERNDYYPFGKRWTTPDFPVSNNRYRFNGKEDQSHVGLSFVDYGARMYDTGICRWAAQDPLAEKYYIAPSFTYRLNLPISYMDPMGK